MVRFSKLMIKVIEGNEPKWVHFCYLPPDIYNKLCDLAAKDGVNQNERVERWAEDDFGITATIVSPEGVKTLKTVIKSGYKNKYPEMLTKYSERPEQDRLGLVRCWMCEHIEKEVELYGK